MTEVDASALDAAEIWYLLDGDDRIVDVGGAWDEVAAKGGALHLAGEQLLGSSIYNHVAGHFTKKFLRAFLAQARLSDELTRQAYRCDSPAAKRLMEMRAVVEGLDRLRVSHVMLGERALPFAVHVREAPRAQARRLRCSSCNRLRLKDGQVWMEPEECLAAGETALVMHTICPDCRMQVGMRRQGAIFFPAQR